MTDTWPCANYTAPRTCLTVGSTTPCDHCSSHRGNTAAPGRATTETATADSTRHVRIKQP